MHNMALNKEMFQTHQVQVCETEVLFPNTVISIFYRNSFIFNSTHVYDCDLLSYTLQRVIKFWSWSSCMRLYAYAYVVYISEIDWKFCVLVNTIYIQYSFDDDACARYIPALLILQFRYLCIFCSYLWGNWWINLPKRIWRIWKRFFYEVTASVACI